MQRNQISSLLFLLFGAFGLAAQEPVQVVPQSTDGVPPPPVSEQPMEELLPYEPAPAPTAEKTYEMFDIQKAPAFPGGEAEMLKFLSANIKYPALARENAIQGSVVISFVVQADGTVGDAKIVKDIGAGCGKEALRVVSLMPRWKPGEANGEPVRVRYTLPVRFKLTGDEASQPAPPPPLPPAEYPGGEAALDDFLDKNVNYPKKARRAGAEGTVVVECQVGTDGKLLNPKVVRSLHPACDREALRVVKKMPNWVRRRSGPVMVKIEVPFLK